MTKPSKTIENTAVDADGTNWQAKLAMEKASLARLSAIKPTDRVVREMTPDATTVADIPNFPLEDGDAFYIPSRLDTVQVAGAVYNANAFRDERHKTLIAYLNDAGGAMREADSKHTFIIRTDGTMVSRRSHYTLFGIGTAFEKLTLLPGDAIIVPEKLRASSMMNDFLQVTQFASQTALTAAALSVIK
jgi:protein involved in polysaccharide export with SLBB domain